MAGLRLVPIPYLGVSYSFLAACPTGCIRITFFLGRSG
jgi:hypothetical protein